MAAAPLNQDASQIDSILSKVRELAVLPHVVYKVLEISGATDTSTVEIESAIAVDPGFSSKVLTVANSAFYALPKKVTSIREAVLFLGFKSIRQLAMTVGIYDMFVGKTDKESIRRRTWWRRSVDTAVCSRWIAKECGRIPLEDAYTVGLLHLIGKTLLDRFGGKDYESVETLMRAGLPDTEAERKVFGCDHVEVAAAAAVKWGFPDVLVEGIKYTEPPSEPGPAASLRACVAIASRIAHWAIDRATDPEESDERQIPKWSLDSIGIDPNRTEAIIRGANEAIAHAATMQI